MISNFSDFCTWFVQPSVASMISFSFIFQIVKRSYHISFKAECYNKYNVFVFKTLAKIIWWIAKFEIFAMFVLFLKCLIFKYSMGILPFHFKLITNLVRFCDWIRSKGTVFNYRNRIKLFACDQEFSILLKTKLKFCYST